MFGSNRAYDKLSARNVELARQVRDLNIENKILYKEKSILSNEKVEQEELIERIKKLVNANRYNNEKAILNKIRELVRPLNQN